MSLNLKQIMNELNFNSRIDIINKKLDELRKNPELTNCRRKEYFDINHIFPENLESYSMNRQWREITLALEITRIQRFWNRKYYFYNLNTKLDSNENYRQFFKPYCNLAKIRNRNYYKNGNKATAKQMIKWTNELVIKELITVEIANKYFEYLENVVAQICNKEIQNKDVM